MQQLKWFGVFMVALAGAIIGIFGVLPFGLVVDDRVILPLAMIVGAMLSAVGASWMDTRLAGDQTRTRLLAVVVSAEAGAVLAALILVALELADAARPVNLLPPPGVIGLAASLALALDVSLAVRRFRAAEQPFPDQRRLMLVLLALAIVSVPATIVVAGLFGLTGA